MDTDVRTVGTAAEECAGEELSFESEQPLCQYFNVDCGDYATEPLLESDIGARAAHSLSAGRRKVGGDLPCKSVGDVLRLSPLQLMGYRSMGRLSVERVLDMLRRTLGESRESAGCSDAEQKERPELRQQVLAMLRGEDCELSALAAGERKRFSEYAIASELLGRETALAAAEGQPAAADVVRLLRNFYTAPLKLRARRETCYRMVCALPPQLQALPVEPFILAYRVSVGEAAADLDAALDSETTVLDFARAVLDYRCEDTVRLGGAERFVKWLNFDRSALCRRLTDCFKAQKESARFAFEQRLSGETLEAVGGVMDVTRERVRQIVKKVGQRLADAYSAQRRDHDIVTTLYALRGGDTVLRYDEIAAEIGDESAQLIWYLAKSKLIDCEEYHFSRNSGALVVGSEAEHTAVLPLLGELPEVVERSEMPRRVAEIAAKHGVAEELLRMQLRSVYRRRGAFYHRGRLTVGFMCGYILRRDFPEGYKIADEADRALFLRRLTETFGHRDRMTARSMETVISEVGVLVDRGKYLHSSYINADRGLIEEVYAYIESSPRVALTYTELFDTFSGRFSGTEITNRYYLQGVLKLMGCPFIMRKDYVTKARDTNLAQEFERFVEQRGKVRIDAILEEFNGLTEINIGFFCQRLPSIVPLDGGYYMHSSQLDIREEDYSEQRPFLLAACQNAPASARALYPEYRVRFPDFLSRNGIQFQSTLFGLLRHMFRGEFFFSRPYISLTDDLELTNRGVLMQRLAGMDSIELEELTELCGKGGIHYVSTRTLVESLSPDFLRVGRTTLLRRELTGADDAAVLDTAQQIEEIVRLRGYCASRSVEDFSWFPELDVPWNAYLLESVAALAGDLLTVLRINTSTIYAPVDVYVGAQYADEDMNSLILRLLGERQRQQPFSSKDEVLEWLQERGLCNVKLPQFLEAEGSLFAIMGE